MKNLSAFHVISILLVSTFSFNFSFSQDCDECSRPSIVYYDCEVSVDQSTDNHIFYWPFAMAIDNIVTNSSSCITWGSSAIADINYLEQGLNVDTQSLMYPPAGGDNGWDYLIRSVVTSSEGFYTLIIYLETSPTRELVDIFSIGFLGNLQSAKDAGLSLVSLINPILEKIKTFERNKRNNPWYAITNSKSRNEGKITVTPQKTIVESGETIDVNINLLDCDGVPLGNRIIDFYPTTISDVTGSLELPYGTEGGTVIPAQATTDESGNVTVQFKAGSEEGPAKIIVWYPHFTPPGLPHALGGTALVNIGPPPGNLFILRGSVSYSYSSFSDTTIKIDIPGHSWNQYKSQSANIETNGRVTAVIENFAEDPSKDFYYYNEAEPFSAIVSGSGIMNDFSKDQEILDGKLISADIRSDNVSGYAIPGVSIQFDYTDDYKYAGIGINIKASGKYTGRMFFYEWSDYGGDYVDYGLSASAGGGSDNGCSITKSDSTRYNANYSFSESSEVANMNGTRHITIKRSLTLSIDPYDALTSISEDEYAQLFPEEFSLSQNYPNPFNPVTSIRFQLKTREMVKLKVYDLLGNEIAILADGIYPQGTYTVQWDASGFSSGVYFYRLQLSSEQGFISTKKLIVLK